MKVLITSVRNEAPYLLEWFAYHKAIGFDHFLVYTNNNTDETLIILHALAQAGWVTFFENKLNPGDSPQKTAFAKAIEWVHKYPPTWIMTLDPDEYLFLKTTETLDEFLSRYPDADAIAINWRIFGSSNLHHKGIGFTIERFLLASRSEYSENKIFKTIFRYREDIIGMGPHRPFYGNGVLETIQYLDTDGQKLADEMKQMGGFKQVKICHDHAQINHYVIRSQAEFTAKRMRGNGLDPIEKSIVERDKMYLQRFDKNDVHEDGILKFMPRLKKEYFDLINRVGIQSVLFNLEARL